MRGARRQLNKTVGIISNAIENLVSVRGISKMTQSIARRQRAAAINANVDRAKTMSLNEKFALFEKYCENMLMLAIDPSNLASCLTATGAGSIRNLLSDTSALGFEQLERMPFIDPSTFGSLLELTATDAAHPLAGDSCVAIPQGHSGNARHLPAIAFPLVKRAVDLKDPSTINWANEANEEWYSLYRIMLRGMIANATASRDFHITAQSDDLGFFLIHIILCAMESVVSGMSGVPNPEQSEQLLRF